MVDGRRGFTQDEVLKNISRMVGIISTVLLAAMMARQWRREAQRFVQWTQFQGKTAFRLQVARAEDFP